MRQGKRYSYGAVEQKNAGEKLRRPLKLAAWHSLRDANKIQGRYEPSVARYGRPG